MNASKKTNRTLIFIMSMASVQSRSEILISFNITAIAARDLMFFRTRYLRPRLKSIRHCFHRKREFWSTQIFRLKFSLHWRHARLRGNWDCFLLVLLTWIQLPTGLSKTTPHSPVIHRCLFYFLSSSNSKWYVLKHFTLLLINEGGRSHR